MTDNEIIKALECCTNNNALDNCDTCPLCDYGNCRDTLIEYCSNTINRQKAEIERLNKQLVFEIESAYNRGTKAVIGEFAEKLKCKLADHYFECNDKRFEDIGNWLIHEVTGDLINELMKEMGVSQDD